MSQNSVIVELLLLLYSLFPLFFLLSSSSLSLLLSPSPFSFIHFFSYIFISLFKLCCLHRVSKTFMSEKEKEGEGERIVESFIILWQSTDSGKIPQPLHKKLLLSFVGAKNNKNKNNEIKTFFFLSLSFLLYMKKFTKC